MPEQSPQTDGRSAGIRGWQALLFLGITLDLVGLACIVASPSFPGFLTIGLAAAANVAGTGLVLVGGDDATHVAPRAWRR